MRPWHLALLALLLLGAGASLHALVGGSTPTAAPPPGATVRDAPRPAAAPPARLEAAPEPEVARPPAERARTSAEGAASRDAADGGRSPAPPTPLDTPEQDRATLRLEALALSKDGGNPAAAALAWKPLVATAPTPEAEAEALLHLGRAQARTGDHLDAAESYRRLLELPAKQPYEHDGYRLQIGAALFNAKDYRGALAELDALRARRDANDVTRAGASWVRVQCLDALGDPAAARAAAEGLLREFEGVEGAEYALGNARRRLERDD